MEGHRDPRIPVELWTRLDQLEWNQSLVRDTMARLAEELRKLQQLIVRLDDTRPHDRDTLVLFNDEERALLKKGLDAMPRLEWEQAQQTNRSDMRKAWHQTLWGRAGVVIGALVSLADVYQTIRSAAGR